MGSQSEQVLFPKMINDSISDLFTRIRNASLVCQDKVLVPYNKMNKQIIQIFLQHGFIREFKEINTDNNRVDRVHGVNQRLPFVPRDKSFVVTLKYEKNTPVILKIGRAHV